MVAEDNEFSIEELRELETLTTKGSWFCAHVIIWQQYKDGIQDDYGIWENIYLIKSDNADEAWQKAEEKGREITEDDDGLEINGRPARWVYGGVRKLISVIDSEFFICKIYHVMENIIELTWNEFTVPDKESLERLIAGEPVNVNYEK